MSDENGDRMPSYSEPEKVGDRPPKVSPEVVLNPVAEAFDEIDVPIVLIADVADCLKFGKQVLRDRLNAFVVHEEAPLATRHSETVCGSTTSSRTPTGV
ncbi:hypothetical protein [Halalkalicoccus salilacus]|uniref:hypothetical protein n=1 Tax=Halalkalicoccus salilacus TaxID=3117459 RepID=UPI00300F09A1